MTDRKAQQRRLERAGFMHVSEWLPSEYAEEVKYVAQLHRPDVAKVLAEPPKPRERRKAE